MISINWISADWRTKLSNSWRSRKTVKFAAVAQIRELCESRDAREKCTQPYRWPFSCVNNCFVRVMRRCRYHVDKLHAAMHAASPLLRLMHSTTYNARCFFQFVDECSGSRQTTHTGAMSALPAATGRDNAPLFAFASQSTMPTAVWLNDSATRRRRWIASHRTR